MSIENFNDALNALEALGIEKIENQQSNHVEKSRELARELIAKMNLKEKVYMVGGHWFPFRELVHGRIYNVYPIPGGGCKRLGIPPALFSDGPRGVVMHNSTAFPTSNVRAAAFDDGLEERIGDAIAKECIAQGANYFAGVCINLLRHPAWGRAQEAYGEDQYLTGRYGVALTKALQNRGVISCPKHYALNSIENLRFEVNANCDKETLSDVYLYHFKKCIDAGAGSIMGAYNKVNGTYSCENRELLTDILRNEWGFEGFAISDFVWGVHDGAESLEAGLDIEMPMSMQRGGKLVKAVKSGKVKEEVLDKACENVISTLLRFGVILRKQTFGKDVVVCEEHKKLAREALEKGAVLLKNNGVLPITDKSAKIAIVGRFADEKVIGDKGSSCVFPPYIVTPKEGLEKTYKNAVVCSSSDVEKCKTASKDAEKILVFVGNNFEDEGEFVTKGGDKYIKGGDRKLLRMHNEDIELINELSKLGKPLVVVFYAGSAVIIEEWKDKADAILYAGYPGLEGGNALSNIISGKVNPSGKLPFTVAKKEEDYPKFLYKGEGEEITYEYYHGYAKFEKENIEPAYPFGYGLSYTTFEYGDMTAESVGDEIKTKVAVKNIGNVDGEEAVLAFVGSNIEGKPHKLLKGFARISLKAGELGECEIVIKKSDLELYNNENGKCEIPKRITVYLGANVEEAEKRGVTLDI